MVTSLAAQLMSKHPQDKCIESSEPYIGLKERNPDMYVFFWMISKTGQMGHA